MDCQAVSYIVGAIFVEHKEKMKRSLA